MDFWAHHGWLFLFGVAFFPRITTLVAGTFHGFGPFAWVGWFFAPHLTVAVLATMTYWETNPVLCVISWFFAFGGSSAEGKAASKAKRRKRRRKENG